MQTGTPKIWEIHILVCENTRNANASKPSCGNGADVTKILAHLKARTKKEGYRLSIRAQRAGCMDLCYNGPVIAAYPSGRFFRITNIDEADAMFDDVVSGNTGGADHLVIEPESVAHVRARIKTGVPKRMQGHQKEGKR